MDVNQLVYAPCIFCGYNGSGFYQENTHHSNCPFFNVGGLDERVKVLINAAFSRRLKIIPEVLDVDKCELCGEPATHFCECEMCHDDGGRWLCDDCSLMY